ncbi:uncharacterized protein LOC111614274 [Centruroides sculpturatus]|uniref:uncharacterized protein LOC111614274 n=1 Tax=Centruroides sculpturatus TaxID=218467 RepID=UPI000C6D9380|nr:uncharacterized protein LOC111614274 [Centruroides sculpturatus]
MQYERFLNYFLILTLFLCYAKCNNTNVEDVDDFQQTSMMLENAEMRIKTALKSVLKRSLPYLMRIFEEVNVSSPCMKSSVLFLKDLMKLKEWPLRMIDSFGKLPAGMLGMTQWMSGDYDQCLDIEIPQDKKQITDKEKEQIRGKYCALTIGMQESLKHIAKSIHKLENNSLIKLAKEIIKPIKLEDLFNIDVAKMKMGIRLDVCIPSTCIDKDLRNIGNWSKFFEYILGASPYKSLHNLYSTNLDESTKSMCGVKFLLVNIVVLGHVCVLALFFPTLGDKYSNIFKHVDLLLFEIILQGVTMIEAFFFYSGFMVMYLRQKTGRNSAKYYIMFLVKRIIRYTLPIFFVLGFAILLPLLGEGPHWHNIIIQEKHMENEWWKYISHIHIYENDGSMEFFNVLWFLSVLLQLSILMSLLLYIVDRWPSFGRLAIIVLMLTGIIMYIVDVVSNRYYLMLGIPAASE